MPEPLDPQVYRDLVRQALAEDLGSGDLTTRAIVPAAQTATGMFLAKRACVVAGLDAGARSVPRRSIRSSSFSARRTTATSVRRARSIARVNGPAASLLVGERTALNFLQWLSGIATDDASIRRGRGRPASMSSTRARRCRRSARLAKYAVRCGGGVNHRMGLYDGVLIKDNHIRLAGGIEEAVKRVRATGTRLEIEVEAQSLADVDAAIAAGADIIMLDNLDDGELRRRDCAHRAPGARRDLRRRHARPGPPDRRASAPTTSRWARSHIPRPRPTSAWRSS